MKTEQQFGTTTVRTTDGIRRRTRVMHALRAIVRWFRVPSVRIPGGIKHPWSFIHTLHVTVIRNTGESRGLLGNPWYCFTDIEIGEAMSEAGVPGGNISTMITLCLKRRILKRTPMLYQLSEEAFQILRPLLAGPQKG